MSYTTSDVRLIPERSSHCHAFERCASLLMGTQQSPRNIRPVGGFPEKFEAGRLLVFQDLNHQMILIFRCFRLKK